jgi:ABC-type multidrug transport system ATPase subunit
MIKKLFTYIFIFLTCTTLLSASTLEEDMAIVEKFQQKAKAFKEDLRKKSHKKYPTKAFDLAEAFCKGIKAKDWDKVRSYTSSEAMQQLEKDIKNVEANPISFEKELQSINCKVEEVRMKNQTPPLYKIYFKNFDRIYIQKRGNVLKVIKF